MRKFLKNLSNMSLFQQLATIIVLFGGIIIVFFTIYMRGNINDFVTNQCMNLLQRSQESVIESYRNNNVPSSDLGYDSDVMHFIYIKDKMQVYYGGSIYQDVFLSKVTELVEEHENGVVESIISTPAGKYYYRLTSVTRNIEIISLLHDSYSKNIESQLLNGVSNNTAIVFSIMFFLLILWVGTIITPLQQIKNYIEKIRKGDESASLSVERADEIGELAKALVDMREEIVAQEQTKEEMIHNISHDLKTPIAIIKSYAESIRDGIYPYDTLDKSVDVIVVNAERLEKKVYSLLFLNRLEYVMEQERETDKTTDMNKLIKEVVLSLKMIRTEVKVDKYMEKNVFFKGDEESWRVVVSNLLDNALRYANKKIVIDLQKYSLGIYNDGPQFAEDQTKKLFKPFEKGDKGKFGLGLSICYKVCNAYGYKIEAENMPEGVIFIITAKEIPEEKKTKKSRFGSSK